MEQRVIKFKAWNIKKNEWHAGYETLGGFSIFGEYLLLQGISLEELNDLKVMQFTGLLDKNGKEIYEGDILKDGKGQYGHVLWAYNSWLMEWMVRDYEGHLTYDKMLDDCFGYGEIIGNIYETPNLLTDNT